MSIFIDTLARTITDSRDDADATREDWLEALDIAFGAQPGTPTTQIATSTLDVLKDAARKWSSELSEYVIDGAEDEESRQSYTDERDRIDQTLANL